MITIHQRYVSEFSPLSSWNSTGPVFLVASSREDVANKSRGNRPCRTRMLYGENGPVEFKLYRARRHAGFPLGGAKSVNFTRCQGKYWSLDC